MNSSFVTTWSNMVYRVSGITSVMIMISISTSFARECKCSWREVEGRRTFQQQLLNIPQICGRNQANGSKGGSELVSLHLANSERWLGQFAMARKPPNTRWWPFFWQWIRLVVFLLDARPEAWQSKSIHRRMRGSTKHLHHFAVLLQGEPSGKSSYSYNTEDWRKERLHWFYIGIFFQVVQILTNETFTNRTS